MKRRKLWRWISFAFLAVAAVFLVGVLLEQWEEARRLQAEVSAFSWDPAPGWLAAALAVAVLDLFWMAAVWVFLYRASGERLAYARGVRIWMATNLGRYIPGKIWQLSGLAVHLRRTGGSGAVALSSSLTFQVVTLLTGAAVSLALLGGRLELLPSGSPLGLAAVLVLFLALLHPVVIRRATGLAARVLGEEEVPGVPAGRDLGLAALGMIGSWLLYGLGFWCLLRGLTPSAPASVLLLTGIFAASYVAGYLVLVAPGGLVVREGAMAVLLAALSPLGAGVASVVAVAARIWVMVAEVLGVGGAFLGTAGEAPRERREERERR